jgi:protein-L-isoaspartate(D-aspartate) O-methyltransferase
MTTSAETFAARRHDMVLNQLRRRGLTDERVLEAMSVVPREEFVLPGKYEYAYDDAALPIGYGQTISQPYMVAIMLEALQVEPGQVVLEVGAGSGYQAALLGQLAAAVYAVELVPELAARAAGVIARLGYGNVHIIAGDGSLGYPEAAPYDRIIVAAAAPSVPPPLVEQLAEGGRLTVPVGGQGHQECVTATKQGGELVVRRGLACTFVPLRGQHGWAARSWPGE